MMWVAESPDASYVISTGIKNVSSTGKSQLHIAKLKASDGSIVWEMNYGTASGVETVAFTSDGGFVVGGFIDSNDGVSGMHFKSGGQVESGKPFIGKISKADADGTSAPSGFTWTYSQSGTEYSGSAKALRVDSSDNIYFVAGTASAVIKIDKNGNEVWKTGQLDSKAQMNDLELASDGLVVVGHKTYTTNNGCSNCSIIKGHMKKLDTSGKEQWSKDYGNYGGGKNQFDKLPAGDWALIYNECWGVAPRYDTDGTTQNGFVLACGTGIEGCTTNFNDALLSKCKKDPRTTWRSLAVATDLKGERVYSRMDSYQGGDTKVWAAAAEYVVSAPAGKHMIITDEAMGFGVLTIKAYDNQICTKADVVGPPDNETYTDDQDTGEGEEGEGEGEGDFWGWFGFGGGDEEDEEGTDEEDTGGDFWSWGRTTTDEGEEGTDEAAGAGIRLPWMPNGASTVKYSAASVAAMLYGTTFM